MGDSEGGAAADAFRVAIVRFDSTDRVGSRDGVPGVLLFAGGQRIVVSSKKETKRNQWAKVRLLEGVSEVENTNTMLRAEVVEIFGPVGDFPNELYAYQV